MRHLLTLFSFLILTFPSDVYSAQKRVALVIGNGSYRNYPLRNPVNDARLMRIVLRKAGFSVTILENASKRKIINAIRRFRDELRYADAALFYFSGHGNQHDNRNWLIPIGANIQRESDLEFEAVNSERILAEMKVGSSSRVNIVILDACRSNPTFRSSRSANRGLANPKVQPEGSILAFSTAPGTVAWDGEGSNSPYVAELSKHMLTPGLKIEDVFKRVRVGVKKRTERKPSPQIPWENSALMGDFYFVPSDNIEITSTPNQVVTPTPNQIETTPILESKTHGESDTKFRGLIGSGSSDQTHYSNTSLYFLLDKWGFGLTSFLLETTPSGGQKVEVQNQSLDLTYDYMDDFTLGSFLDDATLTLGLGIITDGEAKSAAFGTSSTTVSGYRFMGFLGKSFSKWELLGGYQYSNYSYEILSSANDYSSSGGLVVIGFGMEL